MSELSGSDLTPQLDRPKPSPPAPPAVRRRPSVVLSTGFGVGFSPVAPGTVGAVLGLPLAWALAYFPVALQVVAVVVLAGVGVWLTTRAGQILGGEKDPGCIVLDEIVSMPITFFLIHVGPASLGAVLIVLLGFGLNRLFDITKPPPARRLEKLPDGWGVMADDLMAGVYSNLAFHFLGALGLLDWLRGLGT